MTKERDGVVFRISKDNDLSTDDKEIYIVNIYTKWIESPDVEDYEKEILEIISIISKETKSRSIEFQVALDVNDKGLDLAVELLEKCGFYYPASSGDCPAVLLVKTVSKK